MEAQIIATRLRRVLRRYLAKNNKAKKWSQRGVIFAGERDDTKKSAIFARETEIFEVEPPQIVRVLDQFTEYERSYAFSILDGTNLRDWCAEWTLGRNVVWVWLAIYRDTRLSHRKFQR